jgi:response regulator NasT
MHSMVKNLNLSVVGSNIGTENASVAAQSLTPDLCIVAVDRPDADWLKTIESIHAIQQTPVVVVTTLDSNEDIQAIASTGAAAILGLDLTRHELMAALTVAWNHACQSRDLNDRILALTQRLEDRKIIEKAKWLLIERLAIDEESAMRRLQKQARDHRRTLVEVARGILESAELLTPEIARRTAG